MKEKLIIQINEQSEILENARNKKQKLEEQLKEISIKESGLEINMQYLDKKGQKIWIERFKFEKWSKKYILKAITNKVKKDGTNGLQSHCSWGYNIEDIKIIEEN